MSGRGQPTPNSPPPSLSHNGLSSCSLTTSPVSSGAAGLVPLHQDLQSGKPDGGSSNWTSSPHGMVRKKSSGSSSNVSEVMRLFSCVRGKGGVVVVKGQGCQMAAAAVAS